MANPITESAAYLADTRNDDIPLIRFVKQWIVDDLHKSLEDVISHEFHSPPVYTGADESTGWMNFTPGKIVTVSVKFKDGDVGFKNFNWDDYSTERT